MSSDFSLFPSNNYNPLSKTDNINNLIYDMVNKINNMFVYSNLPDTIPQRILELYLQTYGYVGIIKHENNLYCMYGGRGGEPDYNYMPTKFTVSNPALRYSDTLTIDKECIVIANDPTYKGLTHIHSKYATQLVENDLTIRTYDISLRAMSAITAGTDNAKKSAENFLKSLEDGKLAVIGNAFDEMIKVLPYASSNAGRTIKELIELQQYIKANWYNEIGIQSNYNMKRENLNQNETETNEQALVPLIENMLEQRKIGIEKVNKLFDTNWSVELNSIWKKTVEKNTKISTQVENKGGDNIDTE